MIFNLVISISILARLKNGHHCRERAPVIERICVAPIFAHSDDAVVVFRYLSEEAPFLRQERGRAFDERSAGRSDAGHTRILGIRKTPVHELQMRPPNAPAPIIVVEEGGV